MNIFSRALAVLASVVALLIPLSATPANATPTTTNWSFSGSCCIYVPGGTSDSSYFQTDIEANLYFKISSMDFCVNDSTYGYTKVTVELYRADGYQMNEKVITCTGTAKWSMVNKGKYHFHLWIQGPFRAECPCTMSGKYADSGATL